MGNKVPNTKFVKKHAATIHCFNSLSLLQRKISNALLHHAYDDLMVKEEHKISLKELCNIIGYASHNYDALKDAMRKLVATVVEWNIIDDDTGEEDWSAAALLASVRIRKRELCEYSYSSRIKQFLYNPSIYGKINIAVQARFKSNYGLALYENCVRYQSLPNTKWFSLELFRKLMGVPDGKYPIFRDFKRRVLDKAVEEVNAYSDIQIEPTFDRVGRNVARIKFELKAGSPIASTKSNVLSKNIEPTAEPLFEKLTQQFGLTPRQATLILTQHEESYIEQKIAMVMASKNFQRGEIVNLAAYLQAAITENYALPTSSRDLIFQERQLEFSVLAEERKRKEEIEGKLEVYDQLIAKRFFQVFEALDKPQQENITSEWYEQISNRFILKLYSKDGLKHPAVYSDLRLFIANHYSDLYSEPLTFERYCEGER